MVNDWVFWVSYLEMAVEYFACCFCFCFGHSVLICGRASIHSCVLATTVCTFCPFFWLIATCYSLLACTRRHLNSSLQLLFEWPNFLHLKHCFMWGGSLLGSQRWSTQPILSPCLTAAVTWFEQSVITRIKFVGFPVALLVIRSALIKFIAVLLRSSSFTSFSCMLWWTFKITKPGLDLAFGRVFLALIEVFGKTSCRIQAFIRHSLELWSSAWIKKSLLFGSSLMQLVLSWGKLLLIERAKWTCVGPGLIVNITGLIVSDLVFGYFRFRFCFFFTWTNSCSSCDISSAMFRASERSALNWLISANAVLRTWNKLCQEGLKTFEDER